MEITNTSDQTRYVITSGLSCTAMAVIDAESGRTLAQRHDFWCNCECADSAYAPQTAAYRAVAPGERITVAWDGLILQSCTHVIDCRDYPGGGSVYTTSGGYTVRAPAGAYALRVAHTDTPEDHCAPDEDADGVWTCTPGFGPGWTQPPTGRPLGACWSRATTTSPEFELPRTGDLTIAMEIP